MEGKDSFGEGQRKEAELGKIIKYFLRSPKVCGHRFIYGYCLVGVYLGISYIDCYFMAVCLALTLLLRN